MVEKGTKKQKGQFYMWRAGKDMKRKVRRHVNKMLATLLRTNGLLPKRQKNEAIQRLRKQSRKVFKTARKVVNKRVKNAKKVTKRTIKNYTKEITRAIKPKRMRKRKKTTTT